MALPFNIGQNDVLVRSPTTTVGDFTLGEAALEVCPLALDDLCAHETQRLGKRTVAHIDELISGESLEIGDQACGLWRIGVFRHAMLPTIVARESARALEATIPNSSRKLKSVHCQYSKPCSSPN